MKASTLVATRLACNQVQLDDRPNDGLQNEVFDPRFPTHFYCEPT